MFLMDKFERPSKEVDNISHSYDYEEFNEIIVHRLFLRNTMLINFAFQLLQSAAAQRLALLALGRSDGEAVH